MKEALITPDQEKQIRRITEDANYRTIFGNFDQNLSCLCLTTPQIKRFIADQPDSFLREDGWAYFRFLFRVLKEFFLLVTSLPRSIDGYLANYGYALLAYVLG